MQNFSSSRFYIAPTEGVFSSTCEYQRFLPTKILTVLFDPNVVKYVSNLTFFLKIRLIYLLANNIKKKKNSHVSVQLFVSAHHFS